MPRAGVPFRRARIYQMNIQWVRKVCLSFPNATEQIQWENHLLFKVGGKMFAMLSLEPGGNWMSLKAAPEEFNELVERPGVIPAPYLARAKWVALEHAGALPKAEIERLLRLSYDLVFAKLPKRLRTQGHKTRTR